METFCKPVIERRHEAAKQMVERVIQAGYNITWDQVSRYAVHGTAVYKQHIIHALMDQGYCSEIYGELERRLFSRGSGGKQPGIAYLPIQYADAADAIRVILAAGGVPVLAHPGPMDNYDAIEEWRAVGLQGIEAFHSSHSDEDVMKCLELAAKHDLIITGGSDFHGEYGNGKPPLGSVNAGIESVLQIMKRKLNLQQS